MSHHERLSLNPASTGSRGGSVWKKKTCLILHMHINVRDGAACAWAASVFGADPPCQYFYSGVIPSFAVVKWGSRKLNQSNTGFNL